jgi:hypothetical protein
MPGGKLGVGPSRRRRAIAGRAWSVCPANHRAVALEQPRPAELDRSPQRATPPRQVGIVRDHDLAGVQGGGRELEHLEGAGDVRGPLPERRRRQHVKRSAPDCARDVAPGSRGDEQTRQRHQGPGYGQRHRAAVEDHVDVAGHAREVVAQTVARELERMEHALDIVAVRFIVTGAERR